MAGPRCSSGKVMVFMFCLMIVELAVLWNKMTSIDPVSRRPTGHSTAKYYIHRLVSRSQE